MTTPLLPVVQIDKVTKSYGNHTAVSDLSLAVPPGALYGFIGPNGSGKTTTIRMILRIIYPDIGRIDVLGNGDASAANDRVGYLPEERCILFKLDKAELRAVRGWCDAIVIRAQNDRITGREGCVSIVKKTLASPAPCAGKCRGL